jgi:Uma2 family endonuclease
MSALIQQLPPFRLDRKRYYDTIAAGALGPDDRIRPESKRGMSDQPRPRDALLVVEVADTSLLRDRNVKPPLYAQVAIPELWLLDLNTNAAFVHRDPADGVYGPVQRYTGDDTLAPLAFPDHRIAVADLMR